MPSRPTASKLATTELMKRKLTARVTPITGQTTLHALVACLLAGCSTRSRGFPSAVALLVGRRRRGSVAFVDVS